MSGNGIILTTQNHVLQTVTVKKIFIVVYLHQIAPRIFILDLLMHMLYSHFKKGIDRIAQQSF